MLWAQHAQFWQHPSPPQQLPAWQHEQQQQQQHEPPSNWYSMPSFCSVSPSQQPFPSQQSPESQQPESQHPSPQQPSSPQHMAHATEQTPVPWQQPQHACSLEIASRFTSLVDNPQQQHVQSACGSGAHNAYIHKNNTTPLQTGMAQAGCQSAMTKRDTATTIRRARQRRGREGACQTGGVAPRPSPSSAST